MTNQINKKGYPLISEYPFPVDHITNTIFQRSNRNPWHDVSTFNIRGII